MTEILHVFGPHFFFEFLEWDYKLRPDSDHVAKFQGDRSRDLGESVAKIKHHGQNIRPSGTVVPGGLIKNDARIPSYFEPDFLRESITAISVS